MHTPADYLKQSRQLSEAGLLREALTPLHVGLGLFPQSPELWYEKYRLLKRLGSNEAYAALVECRRVGPTYLPALQAYYEELLRQNRIREAYQVLEEVLKHDPENPRWWLHKGFWALYFGQQDEAERPFSGPVNCPIRRRKSCTIRRCFWPGWARPPKPQPSLNGASSSTPTF